MWSKHCLAIVLLGLLYTTTSVQTFAGYVDLPPGAYCAAKYEKGNCCPNRNDDCGAPILGTTCYCDEFCNRTGDDCCPDYWSHCLGYDILDPPEEIRLKLGCTFEGKNYDDGTTFKDNCNMCKCTMQKGSAKVNCGFKRCIVEPYLLDELHSQQHYLGWQATKQLKFWGKTLEEGIKRTLGTLSPSKSEFRMNPVKRIYDPDTLPREFDSRTRWPSQISGIRDQEWCGASWAISTVDVAADRLMIMSNITETIKLSAQRLLSCNTKHQKGCEGGYPDTAWLFLRRFGLVDEVCYPWVGKKEECKLRNKITLKTAHCENSANPLRTKLYKIGPAYRLDNEMDIMHEILTSGPVQATMKVYQDFFVYKSGIYKHSKISEHYPTGYHSVRIIGWGTLEDGSDKIPEKYWLVANSWGTDWGENGLFKIAKGTNESEIENFVLGVWAYTN